MYYSLGVNNSLTILLTVAPSARPLTFGISSAITLPMSLRFCAPTFSIISLAIFLISPSESCSGRYFSKISSSFFSFSTKSSLSPFSNSKIASFLFLTSEETTSITSSSVNSLPFSNSSSFNSGFSLLNLYLFSFSLFQIAAKIIRKVEASISFFPFKAIAKLFLIFSFNDIV